MEAELNLKADFSLFPADRYVGRFKKVWLTYITILLATIASQIDAQLTEYTTPTPLYKEDVRFYDLDRIYAINPARSQGYISWFDAATPPKFQFSTTNYLSRTFNSVEMEKITFSLFEKVNNVIYFLTISDTKMLRIYTPTTRNTPVYEQMLHPATETSTFCTSATGIMGPASPIFYVLCVKSIIPAPTPPVADAYYAHVITIPASPATPTTMRVDFAATSTNTISIRRGVIRAANILTNGPRPVAFVFNAVNLTEITSSLGDQPDSKYIYTIDPTVTPAKVNFVALGPLKGAVAPEPLWSSLNNKYIMDIAVMTINAPSEQRLMILAFGAAYNVCGFRVAITNGDVAITTWDQRVTTTNNNQNTFVQFSMNQAFNLLYGFDMDNKRAFMMDYIVSAGATDTLSAAAQAPSYQGRAAIAGLGECDQIDMQNRFCTIIYYETFEANIVSTVFELIQSIRSTTPNTVRSDRTYFNTRVNGFFHVASPSTDISFLEMSRMEINTLPITGPDITKHKKNWLVLNAARFPLRVANDMTIKVITGNADPTVSADRKVKWTASDLFWELGGPANMNRISWYQNTALPVIFPVEQLKGTGLQYTITGAQMAGGVIKDNPVAFSNYGTGDIINVADNELYLLGNLALVKSKAATANFWVYQCMNYTNATNVTVIMNCTQRFKSTSFQGTVLRYSAFASNQIVVISMIGSTGFSITVVSNSTWASNSIVEAATQMVDGWAYYNPTSRKVFAVMLIMVNTKWIIRVYDLSDNGAGKIVAWDTDPAVSMLTNPAGIARVMSETSITVVDVRGTNALYYLVSTKTHATIQGKLEFNSPMMPFYRDALLRATPLVKASFCLFDNSKLLYYYLGDSKIAGLVQSLDNDYESLSLALTDLGVTRILRVDCVYTPGKNSFALVGARAAGSVAAVYDVENFETLSRRVSAVSILDATVVIDAGFSYYDGSAWFFSGYKQSTQIARVVNDSAPMIIIRSSQAGSQTATVTITNGNSTAPATSFTITATFAAPMTALPSTPTLPTSTTLEPNTTLQLDNFIRYNGPIISAKLIVPNSSLTMDSQLVMLNPRIVFLRVVYQLTRLRMLSNEVSTQIATKRVLQNSDPFYPTILRVRDGLMVAATDLVSSTPRKTRILVFQNTEVFKRDVDLSSPQLCSTLDFRVASDASISMILYCEDFKLRFLKFATDALSPLAMEWSTTQQIQVSGNSLRIPSMMAFCDNTYTRWFVAVRDVNNNAIRIYGFFISSTATTGNMIHREMRLLPASSIFSGVDIVLNNKWYFCILMVDGATNTLKGQCADPSIDPNTGTLPDLVNIDFAGATTGTILNVSCSRNPKATDEFFFCDVLTFDAKIYELRLKISITATVISMVKEAENTYDRYRDAYGTNIASHQDYFVVTGKSIEESFEKFILYKRRAAGGNQWAFYGVDGAECTGPTGNITRTTVALYSHPVDGNPRMMVTDLFNRTLARVYNLTNWNVTFNNAGYYEQQRLMNLVLNLNNESTVLNATMPLRSIFYNPGTPNATVNDLVTKHWFWDYLVWWCIGGGIVALVGILFGLYVCRRETLKKYVNTAGSK